MGAIAAWNKGAIVVTDAGAASAGSAVMGCGEMRRCRAAKLPGAQWEPALEVMVASSSEVALAGLVEPSFGRCAASASTSPLRKAVPAIEPV